MLKRGYLLDKTILKTEDSYAAETRESLHRLLDEAIDEFEKGK